MTETQRRWLNLGLLTATFGFLWLVLLNTLRFWWFGNPQYSYGMSVPLLAAFLFWKRWICRPEKSPLRSARSVGILFGALAFSLLFIRFVRAVDPHNPYAIWVFALAVTGISLCAVYFAGGRNWVRHFAFPVLFVLVAVPWVYAFETFVVQNLMRIVASITVEALDWLGIAAIQHGNVIEINAGLTGIDEACSGVRSMQSTLMVSLFLGEHFRFSAMKRLVLVVASVLLAFGFNVLRALILVLIAVRSGMDALAQWHDRAGYSILAACFVGLYGLSWLMRRGQPEELEPDSTVQPYPLPRGLVTGLLVWLLLLNPLKNAWINHYQPEIVDNTRWTIQWPESNSTFNLASLNQGTMEGLHCERGDSATWRSSDGYRWQAFFIRWEPGSGSAEAYLHTPDVCLPAAGMKMRNDLGIQTVAAGDLKLPFHAFTFDANGQTVFVFRCQFNDKLLAVDRDGKEASNPIYYFNRIKLESRDPIGRQVLEFAISGPETQAEALQVLQREVPQMVRLL